MTGAAEDERGHTDGQLRDLLLAFVDRDRLQDRLEDAVAKAAWPAVARSYSREELVRRLDWGRLHEVFAEVIADEARRSLPGFYWTHADAVRAIDELHAAEPGPDDRATCALDPDESYPCRTVRELYAAQGLAWSGHNSNREWAAFTDEDATASDDSRRRGGPYWHPGVGAEG